MYSRKIYQMSDILPSIICLCEENDETAENLWHQLLPEMWRGFTEDERYV